MAAILMVYTGPAIAQPDPFQPTLERAPPKPRATSDLDATSPGPAEQREIRTLAGAVFAKPAAAARAGDRAVDAARPDHGQPVRRKPEWTNENGVRLSGKGLEFKSPF